MFSAKKRNTLFVISVVVLIAAVDTNAASAATTPGNLTFSNTSLLQPNGDTEPAITIASSGTLAITALTSSFDPFFFGTDLWTGSFGSTPTFRSLLEADLHKTGKHVFGGGDADVDLGSTSTLHASTLMIFFNLVFNRAQLGVSATTCPNGISPSFSIGSCTKKIIDTAGADRPWITSEGDHVYISYHDSGNSSLIHIRRSDDDGYTWKKAGDPIVGQGGTTGDATFNNISGPIVADPLTRNVYMIFTAGEAGIQKATSFAFNNIFVSRSADRGATWTTNIVFHAPRFTRLNQLFPALTVDPTNGKLYAAWTDTHAVWFSTSSDQGSHWSTAVAVNIAPANTTVMPWIAAYNGTVDVVYYATDASSQDAANAVWNVYLVQTMDNGANFAQSLVSDAPNHVGVVCTNGVSCPDGTRNLADLFEMTIDPQNGRAAIIYTDDTFTDSNGNPLPQIVLAEQQ